MENNRMRWIIVIVCMLFFGACTIFSSGPKSKAARVELEKGTNRRSSNKTAMIIGNVASANSSQQPVLVVAYAQGLKNRKRSDRIYSVILDEPGEFMLYVPAGDYRVFTIVDFNNNNRFEQFETSGTFNETIFLKMGEVKSDIRIESKEEPLVSVVFPEKLGVAYDFDSVEYGWSNGEIVKIYDAIFSPKNAEAGLWSADRFIKIFGANIFLVEEYDPEKIPILFVHGIQGSPQEWIPFYIRMDKSRYQPLLFYYPSGMRLELVTRILFERLKALNNQYRFKKMAVTAHSMGGFVTQTLLTERDLKKDLDFVKLYITLATPWTGFESADLAIATSPVVLPSWIDVSSRSVFIKKLLKKTLPKDIPYYLFYGKNDQVSGGKALDQRAFMNAKAKLGFQVNHASILSDKKVWLAYQQILDDHFY